MKSIVFIIPYIGKWPIWFPAFLKSCAANPTIDWLFFTDCDVTISKPDNVTFVKSSLSEIEALVVKNDLKIKSLNVRKLCDLKPAYGLVFKDYIKDYDFWGFCDVDIIWGDIRKFISADLLDNFDIISTLEKMISGHFTIFKNTTENAVLFKHGNAYQEIYKSEKHLRFDEVGFTNIVAELVSANSIKVCWDKKIIAKGIESEAHQEYYLDRWLYKNGKIVDLYSDTEKEYMYLHFINWKKMMKTCNVKYKDNASQFYISYTGIHYNLHSVITKTINSFKNFFNGYYVRLKRRDIDLFFLNFKKRLKKRLLVNE